MEGILLRLEKKINIFFVPNEMISKPYSIPLNLRKKMKIEEFSFLAPHHKKPPIIRLGRGCDKTYFLRRSEQEIRI
jgi:hypothetical protein